MPNDFTPTDWITTKEAASAAGGRRQAVTGYAIIGWAHSRWPIQKATCSGATLLMGV
jgi:hypothetical protein